MDKLIISCCIHDENAHYPPEAMAAMPKGIRAVADSVREAHDAGAAAVHVHMPHTKAGAQVTAFNSEGYHEFTRLVRQTDVIYEYRGPGPYYCGYWRRGIDSAEWTARLKEWRKIDLGDDKPDMVPCIVGPLHHDWGTDEYDQHYVMPSLAELEDHMLNLRKGNVKPYFEVWGANSLYNVRWMAEKGLIDAPYWIELAMGIRGSTSPPATIKELLYITEKLPEHSMWFTYGSVPVKGNLTPQQLLIFLTQAITLGGHVRCGLENCPYNWDGSVAKSNAQIVEGIVRVARAMGREVATSAEARQMMGLPPSRQ